MNSKGSVRSASHPNDSHEKAPTLATARTTDTLSMYMSSATLGLVGSEAGPPVETPTRSWPSPENIIEFLLWACNTYRVDADVRVQKIVQSAYSENFLVGKHGRLKHKHRHNSSMTNIAATLGKSIAHAIEDEGDLPVVEVKAEYDSSGNLHHLVFSNNRSIPTGVLQIINIAAQFHPYLQAVTIRRGLNIKVFNQLLKLQEVATLTDIRLENCRLTEGCYEMLLEKPTALQHLSLKRSNIDDSVVRHLAQRLRPPSLSSKTLLVLDLASNKITANGAVHLAEMLRLNRKLCYLSVMGNALGDRGVMALLDTLAPFVLRPNECEDVLKKRIKYNARKIILLKRTLAEMLEAEKERKRSVKRLSTVSQQSGGRGRHRSSGEKRASGERRTSGEQWWVTGERRSSDSSASYVEVGFGTIYARAKTVVEHVTGPFRHPFAGENTSREAEVLYCLGNDALQVLNVAYTEASQPSLRRLARVLEAQKEHGRPALLDCRVQGWPLATTGNLATEASMLLMACDEELSRRLPPPPTLSTNSHMSRFGRRRKSSNRN